MRSTYQFRFADGADRGQGELQSPCSQKRVLLRPLHIFRGQTSFSTASQNSSLMFSTHHPEDWGTCHCRSQGGVINQAAEEETLLPCCVCHSVAGNVCVCVCVCVCFHGGSQVCEHKGWSGWVVQTGGCDFIVLKKIKQNALKFVGVLTAQQTICTVNQGRNQGWGT